MTPWPQTLRCIDHEAMDVEHPDLDLLQSEFKIMRRLNRFCGASDALVRVIATRCSIVRGGEVTLLDFGTGCGDIVREAVSHAQRQGWSIRATCTDRASECLDAARALDVGGTLRYQQVDLLTADQSLGERLVDVAHASLVLHHLSDEGVVMALRQMARCARKLVVWNDLIRQRVGEWGARLVAFGAPLTARRDAVISVRRGFTPNEAVAFAEAAGLEAIELHRWRGARFVLTGRPAQNVDAHSVVAQTPQARPLVRATGLSYAYGSHQVLTRFSFLARAGEIGLLHGPNGAGKTTALRLLAGAIHPQAGSAWCDRVRGPVGYLPQQGGLMSSLPVSANIDLFQRLANVPLGDRQSRGRAALVAFGLEHSSSQSIERLSIGQARRAALATVFASAGDVLLLDEPDAGLDSAGRTALASLLAARSRSGGAAVISSHEPGWLQRCCAEYGITLGVTEL